MFHSGRISAIRFKYLRHRRRDINGGFAADLHRFASRGVRSRRR